MENKRLTRSRHERLLAGVAGGIGNYLNIDPLLVRLAFLVLSLVNGIGILLYLVLWLLVPLEDSQAADTRDRVRAASLLRRRRFAFPTVSPLYYGRFDR